jgi:DNA-binding NtrC family response regulator
MQKTEAKILIIDDDQDVLSTAKLLLKQYFSFVHTLSSPAELLKHLEEIDYDLILLDLNYEVGESSGKEGLAWIEKIYLNFPGIRIIPMTAYGDITLAVEAMKIGARDFITKPWDNEFLINLLKKNLEIRNERTDRSAGALATDSASRAYQEVLEVAEKVAATDASIFITGESGTGKSTLAKYIHDLSPRKNKPFVTVDLNAIPDTLISSELFGHKKGAFTDAIADNPGKFLSADGGTIFLDEIGSIDPQVQSKLLTVLQNLEVTAVGSNHPNPIDIRLISATHHTLDEMVREGSFRQDLLYRINTVEIKLPALRERKEDIRGLALGFLEHYKSKYQKTALQIHDGVLEKLDSHHWPGNIRELDHVIEKSIILAGDTHLTAADIQLKVNVGSSDDSENLNLRDMEKKMILKALDIHKGNITHAAKELGIDRLALYRRLEKYGL